MGGLTVLSALTQVLPQEKFVYLGDTARLPYGTKSKTTVERYALQAAGLLVQRGVKALVVACNTASGMALPSLQAAFANLPIFGVVEPGAQAAAQVADDSGILVLATETTIRGGAYQQALAGLLKGSRVPIYGRSCPLWVTLAEQGRQSWTLTEAVLKDSLRGFLSRGPKTILLGCTHFPVFAENLNTILPSGVNVVDSAQTTAKAVKAALTARDLLNRADGGSKEYGGPTEYFATDGADRFIQVGSTFLGAAIPQVQLIDI